MRKLHILIACLLLSYSTCIYANNNSTEKTVTISYDSSVAKQLEGEWNIITVNNKDVNTHERAFILFNFSDSTFYGNNGCNVLNGKFHINEANKVSFTDIITTMMECHNGTSEKSVMKAINEAKTYKLSEENGIKYLTLFNHKGNSVMQLKNQNINFLNGAWTVSSINKESVTSKNVRIVIDIQEMRIHGNSGCNLFNGTLFLDPYKEWGVEFQELVSTRKMCRDIYIETSLLVALEETQFCKQLANDEIALIDGNGNQLATLKRLQLK